MNYKIYKEYLDYIIGDVSETLPTYSNYKSKYYKNNDYDIILEACGWRLFINENIWYHVQDFFGLNHTETKVVLNSYFKERLNLTGLTPIVCTWHRQRGWY